MARAACKPFNRGMAASKIIKSGRNLRALSTASNPSIASPHTPNRVWHSMKPRVVLRNTWLLSPIKIDLVILSPQVCPGDRPTLASTLHALPYQKSLLVTISISSYFVDCLEGIEKTRRSQHRFGCFYARIADFVDFTAAHYRRDHLVRELHFIQQ